MVGGIVYHEVSYRLSSSYYQHRMEAKRERELRWRRRGYMYLQLLLTYRTLVYPGSTNQPLYRDLFVVISPEPYPIVIIIIIIIMTDSPSLHIFNSSTECVSCSISMKRFFTQSEISQYHMTFTIQHDVLWLQIPIVT